MTVKSIPERFKECSFENFKAVYESQKDALLILSSFAVDFHNSIEAGRNIVLSGPVCVGKTHLAAAVANAVDKQGFSVLFVSAPDFFRMLSDCQMDKGAKALSDVFDELKQPDLLIFDDVFVVDDDDTRAVYEVVDVRYRHKKPLLITSSLSSDDMLDLFGVGVMDRLRDGGGSVLNCDWPSGRDVK